MNRDLTVFFTNGNQRNIKALGFMLEVAKAIIFLLL